jgi:hypothetical protein
MGKGDVNELDTKSHFLGMEIYIAPPFIFLIFLC